MDDNNIAPVAGPRRYKVIVDVAADTVGPLFSVLIKEVEAPKMEPQDEEFRITFICAMDQLPTVTGLVVETAKKLYISPYEPEVKPAGVYQFVPPKERTVVTPLHKEITYLPARKKRVPGGAKTKDTACGKACLEAFKEGGRVKHPADFMEALAKAGLAPQSYAKVVGELVKEGELTRVGHGAYRLPTLQDHLAAKET